MAVVTHVGRSADSGHYIGWIRDVISPSIWWKFDDDKVTAIAPEDIKKLDGGGDWHTAYICFYKVKRSSE